MGAYIDFGSLAGGTRPGTGRHKRPGRPLEQFQQLFGDEARPGGIEMAIALRVLSVDEEPLRHDQMKVILCAGHGNVEQSTFLLDLGRRTGTEVRRHAAVDDVEQIDRFHSWPLAEWIVDRIR